MHYPRFKPDGSHRVVNVGTVENPIIKFIPNEDPMTESNTVTPDPIPAADVDRRSLTPKGWTSSRTPLISMLIGGGLLVALVGVGTGLALAPTPTSCVDALESAGRVQLIQADGLNVAADAIGNATTFNISGITRNTDELGELADDLDSEYVVYNRLTAECRGE